MKFQTVQETVLISRGEAIEHGLSKFLGNPCSICGQSVRYASSYNCVNCLAFKPTGKSRGKPNPQRLEAIQNNEPFYLTGKPCKRGHISKRYTKTAACFECKDFRKSIRRPRERGYSIAKYGITLAQYEEMVKVQNNLCYICEKPEKQKLKNGELKPLAIDHCHDTNRIRKLLCSNCNLGIGNLLHDPALLRKAALYCEVV